MLREIVEGLNEEFEEEAKLSKADFKNWQDTVGKKMKVTYEWDDEGDKTLLRIMLKGKYVASYDNKEQMLRGTNLGFVKGKRSMR